ncbi:MAG: YHYH protein [Planctomycetales bacterium]|nr:YHYH protein [Planctomycetales bacterium]
MFPSSLLRSRRCHHDRLLPTLGRPSRLALGLLIVGLSLSTPAWAQRQAIRSEVNVKEERGKRIIESNGIPDHRPGQFPNRGNPNTITAQRHRFELPLEPEAARRVTPFELGLFGVALNGVPFDPGAAEFWNRDRRSGWQYEALGGGVNLGLDEHNAHVQPTGAYHYHGIPTGLVQRLRRPDSMTMVGYAADGFPIYAVWGYRDADDPDSPLIELKSSYQLKEGMRNGGPRGRHDGTFVQDWEYVAGSGDLDECNGRTGVTPEYPQGTYYYVLTDRFPFIPRAFRGTPDASFMRGPGGPNGGPGRGRPPRPGFPPPPGFPGR